MVPIIDISALRKTHSDRQFVAQALHGACTEFGFFYITGHGVSERLQNQLEELSHQFFALPETEKLQIRMALGGRAWRGFFPVGDELTSGKPDQKEGLYFGTELGPEDRRVRQGLLLHGANLFPAQIPALRKVILDYMAAMKDLGHLLMQGIALSLGLEEDYFRQHFTQDPLCLFRVFHYPSVGERSVESPAWGVGEHTDYGLLTILKQDAVGGLQIKSQDQWLDAPVVPGAFVCNIGDMLDRMTGGYYCSTPHRVLNQSGKDRYSFPFFFDPSFDAEIKAVPIDRALGQRPKRWDGADLDAFEGTYGDYVIGKVGKVFPEL
ncbi:MAG: isopenicillin N synthase family dioxygenase [Bacteroidia bacterium]